MQSLNRLFIVLYALFAHLCGKFRKEPNTKKVYIVAPSIFGDSLILLPPLQGYVDLYKNQKGFDVTLLCRPVIKKFINSVAGFPKDLNVDEVDFTHLINNFLYFRKISKLYRNEAEIVVVPGSSISSELLVSTFSTENRFAFAPGRRNVWPIVMYIFGRITYNEVLYPPIDMMQIQRHRFLLNYLGLGSYKGRITSLRHMERCVSGNYCVICPGASETFKCWPLDRFIHIIDWIIEKYNMEVHLCGGGKTELEKANEILRKSNYKDKVISHVDKTSFTEWVSIVQYSRFVIGNDSATIHIAAASKRPSICIAGAYDMHQFFPYHVDELANDDVLPITLLKSYECRNCRTMSYHAGHGNDSCLHRIKKGLCASCIQDITLDEVKSSIQTIIQENRTIVE